MPLTMRGYSLGIVLLAFTIVAFACHSHRTETYNIRFNPAVGSIYQYETISETSLAVNDGAKDIITNARLDMTAHYFIDKDSDDFLLEMKCDKIEFVNWNGDDILHEESRTSDDSSALADSDPIAQMLKAIKAASIFARTNPKNFDMTFAGVPEAVRPVVHRFNSKANQEQTVEYWSQWIGLEIVSNGLLPIVRPLPNASRHPGSRWWKSCLNKEDINFSIGNSFQLKSVDTGIAIIQSGGQISMDNNGTWLLGEKATGHLTGDEKGFYIVDTATGMPTRVMFAVNVEGILEVDGHSKQIKFSKEITMKGSKVKGYAK